MVQKKCPLSVVGRVRYIEKYFKDFMKEKFSSIKICPLWASVRLSRVSVRTGFPVLCSDSLSLLASYHCPILRTLSSCGLVAPDYKEKISRQHHQMVFNSHWMFQSFKTMTPYCWWAHSEVDVFLTMCFGISTPWYLEVAISSMKPSLLSFQESCLLFSGFHQRSW